MATAQFSGQYGHNMTLEVWSEWNRQDIASNSSTVNVQARLRTNGYASVWGVTVPITITVDGRSETTNAFINIGTNSSLLIFGKDYNVPHNGDGTKTVGIQVSVGLNVGGYESSTVAFDLPLPTIPRASSVDDVTGTLGSPMTININRKNDAFKHTVKYNFGALSGTIATNVDTSVSWTPPLDLATAMPNKTSDWGNITVETYNGSSQIGSSTSRVTLNVPDSVKPTIGSITLTDSNTEVKNFLNTDNTFVQILSNIQVAFNNASGAYGSTISSYRAEIVGKNQSTNSNNGLLGMMNFKGTATVRATATDSRGRTSDAVDVPITVINYFTPQFSFTAQRSGSDNTTVTVTRNARISPLVVGGKQKNKMVISFKYKEHSATDYTVDTGSAGGTFITIDSLTNSSANLEASFSTLKTYDIIGRIEDAFTSYEFITTVGTEKFPLAIRPDGIGLGKTPEKANIIDSAWEYYYNNNPIQHHQVTTNDGKAILLPTGTDLNTVTDAGFYNVLTPLNAPTGLGDNVWKYIRVTQHTNSADFILQEIIDFNGAVSAFRVKSNGRWKDWQYYAVQNSVATFTAVNQTKVYRATIPGPFGLNANATRCGNIVNLSINQVYWYTHRVSNKADETVPVGWRPTTSQSITLTGHAGAGAGTENWSDSFADLHYETDGSINFTICTKANPLGMIGSITWITTDPFPSE